MRAQPYCLNGPDLRHPHLRDLEPPHAKLRHCRRPAVTAQRPPGAPPRTGGRQTSGVLRSAPRSMPGTEGLTLTR